MAVRSLTYLDIPAARRQETASKVMARLRDRLNDPLTSPEQSDQLREQMARLEQWVGGTIPTEGA